LAQNIFPKVAIVDPEVTVTMPKSVTAQTGFDAFAHNFEAYLSVKTSPLVEMMAIEAIKMIKEYLPKALENPNDIEARSKMSLADTLGGLTNSNAGVTLPMGWECKSAAMLPCIPRTGFGDNISSIYKVHIRLGN